MDDCITGLRSVEDEDLILENPIEVVPKEEVSAGVQQLIETTNKIMKKKINDAIKKFKTTGKLT